MPSLRRCKHSDDITATFATQQASIVARSRALLDAAAPLRATILLAAAGT